MQLFQLQYVARNKKRKITKQRVRQTNDRLKRLTVVSQS